MSVQPTRVFEVVCDSCQTTMDDPEFEQVMVFNVEKQALDYATEHIEVADGYGDTGWSEDGEGKHHCEKCPPLTVTADAAAARARALTAADVPLAGFES